VNILEARYLIQGKAEDILFHYFANMVPRWLKAQGRDGEAQGSNSILLGLY